MNMYKQAMERHSTPKVSDSIALLILLNLNIYCVTWIAELLLEIKKYQRCFINKQNKDNKNTDQ